MRIALSVCICFILSLSSCKKDTSTTIPIITNGTYKGTFRRVGVGSTGQISQVSITISDNIYGGKSQYPTYPAISTGRFSAYADTVEFNDASIWTANFDWTLILDFKYNISRENDSIVLTRGQYIGIAFWQNMYKLKKQ